MEGVEDSDGQLSIVLAGHRKLGNDLCRPTMEETGYRTEVFTLDGIAGSQRVYLQWFLHICTVGKIEPEMILTTDAIDLLASKLRTPLQMRRHLTLALEVGYQTGEQPISAGMVDTVLSQQCDDLEPTLTRHGAAAQIWCNNSTRNQRKSKRCSITSSIRPAPPPYGIGC